MTKVNASLDVELRANTFRSSCHLARYNPDTRWRSPWSRPCLWSELWQLWRRHLRQFQAAWPYQILSSAMWTNSALSQQDWSWSQVVPMALTRVWRADRRARAPGSTGWTGTEFGQFLIWLDKMKLLYCLSLLLPLVLLFEGAVAPFPSCSPLAFVNRIVESDGLKFLFDGAPGHPVPPCPYRNPSRAPAEERFLLARCVWISPNLDIVFN